MATINIILDAGKALSDPESVEKEIRRQIKLKLRKLLLKQSEVEVSRGTVARWLREMREKL